MRTRNEMNEQKFNDIIKLSNDGWGRPEIARLVKCGVSTIGYVRKFGSWEAYCKYNAEQKEKRATKKSNTENAVVEVEEYHEEKETLRKIHNCLNCAEYGNNGCGQIMFEKMTDYPDFMCEGFREKQFWLETGADESYFLQCTNCGEIITCEDTSGDIPEIYERKTRDNLYCRKCGSRMF